MSTSSFESVIVGFFRTLSPLEVIGSDPEDIYAFIESAGGQQISTVPNIFEDIVLLLQGIREAVQVFESSEDEEEKRDKIIEIIPGVLSLINKITSSSEGLTPEIPLKLLESLVVNYLIAVHPLFYSTFKGLGIIEVIPIAPTDIIPPRVEIKINFESIGLLFSNPGDILKNKYRWGEPDFKFTTFAYAIADILRDLGISYRLDAVVNAEVAQIDENSPAEDGSIQFYQLKLILYESEDEHVSFGIGMFPLAGTDRSKPGFSLLPFGDVSLEQEIEISDQISLNIESSINFSGGIAINFRPDSGLQVITGFKDGATTVVDPASSTGASVKVGLQFGNDESPFELLRFSDTSKLSFDEVEIAVKATIYALDRQDLGIELSMLGGNLIIRGSEGDGFLSVILGPDGIQSTFDITIGFSALSGLYFRGSGGLEISIPTSIQIGPIEIISLLLSLRPEAGIIPLELSAGIRAQLGPLQVTIERMGLKMIMSFPPNNTGNLGPLDLSFGFKPPNGVGLSVDAGVIRGGGYLSFDFDREEYAGALELTLANFLSIKAIGLITTKMPDGSKGFSLLIILTVEFGTGLQLGFGFTLLGVGGLLGLNRAANGEALVAGIRAGSVANIMFPRDVVANAPRIISDLRAFFPAEESKFLIGPMLKIGWGSPSLISVSLGIIVELSTQGGFSVQSLTILGVLKVALPTEDAPLLLLQVQFLGRIEFDKRRAYFFASLYDSRILFLTIEGELGLLIDWSDNPNFVLSVGGFHPRFTPPPMPFPVPRRIAVELSNNPVYRVRVECYFAVTSNTVQFGARAELEFKIGDVFEISGHIAFDALFQFSPFYFIIEISASVSIKLFGMGVFSIRLEFALSGPTPWRARGSGYLSFLFFEISADFDVTWGESAETTLEPIAVFPLLREELKKEQNWTAKLPEGSNIQVSLRKLEGAKDILVLHPLGTLLITQRAVPLLLSLDKLGNQAPSDFKKFDLSVSGGGFTPTPADEQFAMAQFQNMSDAEKLSRPAFQPQQGGVALSGTANGGWKTGRAVKRLVRYETIVLDTRYKRIKNKFVDWIGVLFSHFFVGSAITKSALSVHQQKLLQPFPDKIDVRGSDLYSVVSVMDNAPFAAEALSFGSEASAREYMQAQVRLDATLLETLHVIPQYEANF